MNTIFLSGNLTRDPELRQTQSGVSVCHFTIAVRRPNCSPDNPITDFFDCNAWRSTAEICNKYLTKGAKVSVQGKLTTRSYEDRNGAKVKAFEIEVETVEFFSAKPETQPEVTRATRERAPQQMEMDRLSEIEDNQLPF